MDPAGTPELSAVLLAGGRGSRLGGVDKGGLEVEGRSLLERSLAALADAAEVVVVGDPVPTGRPVTFCRESPAYGGPVAALLTGVDRLARPPALLAVLAVDMPYVSAATVARLRSTAAGRDGARLVGPDGRAQLALVLDAARLAQVRPTPAAQDGMAMRRLLAPLDLAAVPAVGPEHRDVDTWADLAEP
ncbi:molybdenum cofactor guanylyltransferase [Nocardioides pantholopis]|uniref:molybdenum cofactor guanylyltransferase n=1 Tax=Nocardioides pantholopis TaxID=2483798 RepID=UPI000F09646F|nr:NTP transferase domain-containing protein [Nocardioides pantholopis]